MGYNIKSIKFEIIIAFTAFLFTFSACTESNSSEKENIAAQKQKKNKSKTNTLNVVEPKQVEIEKEVYELPTSPIVGHYYYTGYIGDMAIEMTLNEHDDQKISGSYFYTKYNKEIELIGNIREEYCDDFTFQLTEWSPTHENTGSFALIGNSTAVALGGIWYAPNSHTQGYPIDLKEKSNNKYLSPLGLTFNNKSEANRFYSKHKFINNATYAKQMIVVPDSADYSSILLPVNLPLYEVLFKEGECATDFELVQVGIVKDERHIKLDGNENLIDIYKNTDVLHDTPADDLAVVGVNGMSTDKDGRLCVILSGELNLTILVKDLEELNYHLEGDAYYLKNTMPMGLDPNSEFSDKYPLYLYKKANKTSTVIDSFTVESNKYFMIEDVTFFEMEYWLKVKVCKDNSDGPHHDKNNPNVLNTGWIQLYGAMGRCLSLSYYGNGC